MKIVYVKEEMIYCDGEDHDHPRVYYNLAKKVKPSVDTVI